MSQEGNLRRIEELLQAALEHPPEERAIFLDMICAHEPEIRDAVKARLASQDSVAEAETSSVLLPIGRQVGEYRIRQRLDDSDWQDTYLAECLSGFGPRKASIIISRQQVAGTEALRDASASMQRLQLLDHPAIARFYEAGLFAGRLYFASDLAPGRTLEVYVKNTGLDTLARLRLFLRICDAVQFAHQHLIIHGDIRPECLRVGQSGQPLICEFGLATLLAAHFRARDTRPMQLHDAPGLFASPEAKSGNTLTIASDVYSLGALLSTLIDRRRYPYKTTRRGNQERRRTPESWHEAPQPPELREIVIRATAQNPPGRYPSVAHLREAVEAVIRGKLQPLRPTTEVVSRSTSRWQTFASIAAVLALAWFGWQQFGQASSTTDSDLALLQNLQAPALLGDLEAEMQRLNLPQSQAAALLSLLAAHFQPQLSDTSVAATDRYRLAMSLSRALIQADAAAPALTHATLALTAADAIADPVQRRLLRANANLLAGQAAITANKAADALTHFQDAVPQSAGHPDLIHQAFAGQLRAFAKMQDSAAADSLWQTISQSLRKQPTSSDAAIQNLVLGVAEYTAHKRDFVYCDIKSRALEMFFLNEDASAGTRQRVAGLNLDAGECAMHFGAYGLAERRFLSALDLLKELDGAGDVIVQLHWRLGENALLAGNPRAAEAHARSGLESARQLTAEASWLWSAGLKTVLARSPYQQNRAEVWLTEAKAALASGHEQMADVVINRHLVEIRRHWHLARGDQLLRNSQPEEAVAQWQLALGFLGDSDAVHARLRQASARVVLYFKIAMAHKQAGHLERSRAALLESYSVLQALQANGGLPENAAIRRYYVPAIMEELDIRSTAK